jgi:hypothetical protein
MDNATAKLTNREEQVRFMAETQKDMDNLKDHIAKIEDKFIPSIFTQLTKLRINMGVYVALMTLQLGVMSWTLQQTFAMRGEISRLQQAIIKEK